MLWVALGIATLVTVAVVGYLIGLAVSSPGEVSPATSGDPRSCDQFCTIFQAARGKVCMAQSNLAAAAAFFATCQAAANSAAAVAAALAAISIAAALAAASTAWIPIVGASAAAFAAIAAAAAATAAGVAATAYALMAGAGVAMTQKQSDLNNAQNAQSMAAMDVMSHCSAAQAAACFAMPGPC
jgi:hypothetical protein